MCYVGRLKGSGSQKCSKDRANTRVDLRNAANSLQIEGKGVQPGDPYHWGGVGGRNTEHETIYTQFTSCCPHLRFHIRIQHVDPYGNTQLTQRQQIPCKPA